MVTAAAAGATAVVGLGAAAITAAAGFEQGLSNISAVSGATAAEMGQISDLALRLGKDTSFSASQAAAGIEELIKGGVGIADVMGGAADATLNLAAAGGVDLATAAEISANALAMFNLEGSDMAMVADQIAGAANASSLSVTDFKFSLAAAGSVMAASSQSIESTATAIALMGQAGIKGSDAGTSLKAAFNNLIPTTDKASAKMRELGIITADGVNQFLNLDGSFKQAGEVGEVLSVALDGLSDSQRTLALETMFGSDGMRAGIVLAKAGAEGFDDMAASMGKVTAESVGMQRLDNLRGDLEQLGGSVETAGIVLGTVFLPALRDLTKGATSVVNATIPLLEQYGPGFLAGIGSVAGIIGDNLVPALSAAAAATLAYGVSSLPAMITSLTTAIPLLYAKGAALTASLGPFALVAGAAFLVAKAYDAWTDSLRENVAKAMASNEVMQDVADLQDEIAASTQAQTPEVMRLNAQLDAQRQRYADLALTLEKQAATGVQSQGRMAQAQREGTAALAEQEQQIAASAEQMRILLQWQDAVRYSQEAGVSAGSAYVEYINSSTAAYAGATEAVAALGETTSLTEDEIKTLNEELGKTAQEGATAFGAVVDAVRSFQSEVETASTAHWSTLAALHKEWADATTDQERTAIQERIDAENTGFATSQQNAASAYATAQAANRANLGQMLIDTVNGWQVLGTVPAEMADTLRAGIADHFGVANDEMGLQFGKLLGVIQGVADGTGVAADQMGGEFAKIEAAAVTSANNTAASQERMVNELTAKYNAGQISFQEYQATLAQIPTEIDTVVTHNAVDARQRFIDFKNAQAEVKADIPAKVSDNADEVRGRYLLLSAKRAAMALETPAINITSNADAVKGQMNNVTGAINAIPRNVTVHINAVVDPALERHSPSIIEQTLMSIDDMITSMPTLKLKSTGSIVPDRMLNAFAPSTSAPIVPKSQVNSWTPTIQPVYTAPMHALGSNRSMRSTVDNSHYEITIIQQPGEDPRQLAERLLPELDRIRRQQNMR